MKVFIRICVSPHAFVLHNFQRRTTTEALQCCLLLQCCSLESTAVLLVRKTTCSFFLRSEHRWRVEYFTLVPNNQSPFGASPSYVLHIVRQAVGAAVCCHYPHARNLNIALTEQRWPQAHFPAPLLQNFFYSNPDPKFLRKYENPTPVRQPSTQLKVSVVCKYAMTFIKTTTQTPAAAENER